MILFLHASTAASSSSAMLEQARHSTHDTTRHITSRLAWHVVRAVSCRDVTQRVEFGLFCFGIPTTERHAYTCGAKMQTESN